MLVLQYEPSTEKEIPKNSYMSVAAVCVVVGSLAIGLLLLKLFQARRLRQGEHPGSCPLGHTVAKMLQEVIQIVLPHFRLLLSISCLVNMTLLYSLHREECRVLGRLVEYFLFWLNARMLL